MRSVTEQNIIFLFYLDLRFAIKSKASLEKTLTQPEATMMSITYAPPTPLLRIQLGAHAAENIDNSGVLLVRGMENLPLQHVESHFRQYGETLGSMHLPHIGIAVEFYDIRDCAKARDDSNARVVQKCYIQVDFLDVSAHMDYIRRRRQFFKDIPTSQKSPFQSLGIPAGFRRFEEQDIFNPFAYYEAQPKTPELKHKLQLDPPVALPTNNSMRKSDTLADITPYLQPGLDPTRLRASRTLESAINENGHEVLSPEYGTKGCAENPDPNGRVIPRGNEVDLFKLAMGLETRTTLMVRNVPNRFTQGMFVDFLSQTHKGRFDFVYLRMDYKNRCNVGYAVRSVLKG